MLRAHIAILVLFASLLLISRSAFRSSVPQQPAGTTATSRPTGSTPTAMEQLVLQGWVYHDRFIGNHKPTMSDSRMAGIDSGKPLLIFDANGKPSVIEPTLLRIQGANEAATAGTKSANNMVGPGSAVVRSDLDPTLVDSGENIDNQHGMAPVVVNTEKAPLESVLDKKSPQRETETEKVPADQAAVIPTEVYNDDTQSSKTVIRRKAQPLDFAHSPPMKRLKAKIQRTLEEYYPRHLNSRDHCPWAIMHSFIAFGVDTQLYSKSPGRKRISAIGWLCFNGLSRHERLFSLSDGQIQPHSGPGLQGHEGQFLAMLAQSKVRRDYPMQIEGHHFTVQDLIEYEQATCYSGTELTFKLIALAHYLPHDTRWQNNRGETWDVARILQEEISQPIRRAACGGTHRLMGYSYAVRLHHERGDQLDGQWLRAKKFINQYQKYALSLQNRDGSFSCNWFDGPGNWTDDERKVQTTGHILEWLIYSLPENRLADRRVVKSVDFMASLLLRNRHVKLEVGPQGHAVHALVLYEHRVFGQPFGQRRLRFVDSEPDTPSVSKNAQSSLRVTNSG